MENHFICMPSVNERTLLKSYFDYKQYMICVTVILVMIIVLTVKSLFRDILGIRLSPLKRPLVKVNSVIEVRCVQRLVREEVNNDQ